MTEKLPQPPNSAVSDAPTELALDLPIPDSLPGAGGDSTLSSKADVASERARLDTANETVRLRMATLTEGTSGLPHAHRDVASYVGLIIDGRYQIESAIAQGGMGMVYKARHRLLDKLVAVKVLRPELVHNHDITRRFLTEAQAASAIGSPHIVDVTDFGELPDGATYIVMEYLDGEPLSALLKSVGRLGSSEVVDIARQLTEGLEQAHLGQIVHRDLKPDNVLLIQLGKQARFAKILDFGIAKVASSQNETTRAGKIFGTPHYMSPEQARGESLDARTDIYSLGVMLFEMLTGRLPFAAENPLGVLTQHMYVEAPLLAEYLDPAATDINWEAVVAKCLAKDRTQRYASMAELEADLGRLGRSEPTLALSHLRSLPNLSPKLRRRLGVPDIRGAVRRATAWTILLAAAAVAVFGVLARPEWLGFTSTSLESESLPTPESQAQDALATIDVVLSPIDAHVYQGGSDLGPMPIQLRLRRGQRTELSVRRRGYKTQWLVVDGSQARIQVELRPLPGAAPATAPASLAFGATRTVILADPDLASLDSGQPLRRDAGSLAPAQQDAGAGPPANASGFYQLPVPPGPPPQDAPWPHKSASTLPDQPGDGTASYGPSSAAPGLPPGPPPAASVSQ